MLYVIRIGLVCLLLLAAGQTFGQFVVNRSDFRTRAKIVPSSGDTASLVEFQRVNRIGEKPLQVDRQKIVDSVLQAMAPRLSEGKKFSKKTEIENFIKYYESRKKNVGWRSKINSSDVSRLDSIRTVVVLNIDSTRRQVNGVSAQAIAGVYQKLDNDLGGTSANFFDLGSRISNLRIKWITRLKYTLRNDTLTRLQRSRYIYMDFLSRGVIALDSLSTTVNEYINSMQGSPLSLRFSKQINLTNPVAEEIIGSRQPMFYINLLLDGRLIPVSLGDKITSAGGSIHFIPTFTGTLPAGQGSDKSERDEIVLQFSANFSYVSNNAAEVLFLGEDKVSNFSFSAEIRAGLFSTEYPGRNFNIMFRYNPQELNGSRASLGFTMAPLISNEKSRKK